MKSIPLNFDLEKYNLSEYKEIVTNSNSSARLLSPINTASFENRYYRMMSPNRNYLQCW